MSSFFKINRNLSKCDSVHFTTHTKAISAIGENLKSSSFTGVSRMKKSKKWRAQATLDGKTLHFGYHESEEEAARVYDNWAKDFADRPLNFRKAAFVNLFVLARDISLLTPCQPKHTPPLKRSPSQLLRSTLMPPSAIMSLCFPQPTIPHQQTRASHHLGLMTL